jgi:hypothetical protein
VPELVPTHTPIFIYHSDDDFISVEPDRAAARRLKDSGLDFVYTELSGQGHGFPASIRKELFTFLSPRRLWSKRSKDAWPRASLLAGKATKEERRYLGDPLADVEGSTPDLRALTDDLRLGGGCSVRAASALLAAKPDGAAAAAAKVLKDAGAPFSARAVAARLLGDLGATDETDALAHAVAADAGRPQAAVASAAARALVTLADEGAAGALQRAVGTWAAWLDDKRMGGTMRFSDWDRGAPLLAALVEAWGALDASGDAATLERLVVRGPLDPTLQVETSERVPQDPSVGRAALAGAVAACYARWGADAARFDRLAEAVASDSRAKAAVAAKRR